MSALEVRPGLWGRLADRIEEAPAGDGRIDVWARLAERTDPAQFRPKLAPDIEIKEFKLRWGNDYTMIANPRDLVHYRLDPSDAELLKFMDGTRTVKEIVLERFKDSGDMELSGVADLVRLLQEENFLEERYVDVDAAVGRAVKPVSGPRQKAQQFAKTLTIEWKGPDPFVKWLYRNGFKVFFRKQTTYLSIAFILAGLTAFVSVIRSGHFSLAGQSLAIGFLVLLFLDYFSVFLHELGHALVLTHNGRKVKSAGFLIYFGSPAFFVEASESLMMDRTKAIVQSFAGPYAQMLMGGLCSMIVWAFPGWVLSSTLYKIAVINYYMVFLNLLPMLELDGYYIVADAIQVPDLRPRSLSFIRHDMWHKLRVRERFSKTEVGLALYGIIGVLFTVASLGTSYFYWRAVFGGFVGRLWRGGVLTRVLLLILALFIAGPLIRGALNLARSLFKQVQLLARRVRFRLERKWRVEAAELIDSLPIFDDVPEDALSDLAGRVRLRSLSAGQPVVRQGERASAFYVVRKGTLQVVEEDPASGRERPLRVLGRGEAFGELALKEGSLRTATVRAVEEAEVFEIDKSTFDHLLADMVHVPQFAPTLQAVAEVKELPCFSHLEPDELFDLLEHGEWLNLSPGESIVEQGEEGDSFFAIGSGQAEVFEDGKFKRTLGPGAYFGEIALLFDVPRTATVVARTPMRAYRLGREGFDRLVAGAFKRGTLNPHAALDRTSHH